MDAKEDLLSVTLLGTFQKETTLKCPEVDTIQAMEVDRKLSNRKRKTLEMDGNISNPKITR